MKSLMFHKRRARPGSECEANSQVSGAAFLSQASHFEPLYFRGVFASLSRASTGCLLSEFLWGLVLSPSMFLQFINSFLGSLFSLIRQTPYGDELFPWCLMAAQSPSPGCLTSCCCPLCQSLLLGKPYRSVFPSGFLSTSAFQCFLPSAVHKAAWQSFSS